MKLLAIIGSQRKEGNSYLLAKEALKSVKAEHEIIQLAEKELDFCNFCGKCETEDCIIKDEFNQILEKMKEADGFIFSFPKYFSLSSKFLCFLERLRTIDHFKEYHGGRETGAKPDPNFSPLFKGKPCCLFGISASGQAEEPLRLAAHVLEGTGMKLVLSDSAPFQGVLVKGEDRGEVLKDKRGLEDSKRLAKKLVDSMIV